MPERLQRKRTRGWRMPEGAVYVGRGSKWGNPFVVDSPYFVVDMAAYLKGQPLSEAMWKRYTAQDAVDCYRKWFRAQVGKSGFSLAYEAETELRGCDLVCWCDPQDVCHADWLIQISNPGLFKETPDA